MAIKHLLIATLLVKNNNTTYFRPKIKTHFSLGLVNRQPMKIYKSVPYINL